MTDFSTILFRASANGDIMTAGAGEITDKQLVTLDGYQARNSDPKAKPLTDNMRDEMAELIQKRDNPQLSTTCITRLVIMFAQTRDREEEITSKYMVKGTVVEEENLTLYSRVKKTFFTKNTERLNNKYCTGLPDAGDGPTILDSEEVIDFKSSWSYITFLKVKAKADDKVNKNYAWQGQTYMGLLPKSKRFRLVYGLVNSPSEIILQEKRKLKYQLGVIDDEETLHPEYTAKCIQIEKNHIFDMGLFRSQNPGFDFHMNLEDWKHDIPKEERIHEIVIERDPVKIEMLYKKVERCRKWMGENFK